MDSRLQGRIAVITGASSGLGRAIALRFADCGARVVCADLRSAGVEQEVTSKHGEKAATFVECNVADEANVESLIKSAVDFGGRLDIICNFAGVTRGDKYENIRAHEYPTEDFDAEMAVNTRGTWLCCKYALRQMMEQEPRAPNARGERTRGWIVNASSIAGCRHAPGYTPSKFAVTGMTKQMSLDYALDRIHVNCVCPGFANTPMLKNIASTPERLEALESLHPWNALGQPDDVADAALFLCSDES